MSEIKKGINVNGEQLGTALAAIAALSFAYLTGPSFMALFVPESAVLWSSPLNGQQGLSLFAGVVAIGMALNLANAARRIKDNGEFEIPLWLIVGVFAIICVIVSMMIMLFAFSVTFAALASFGVESAVAGVVAVLAALFAAFILR